MSDEKIQVLNDLSMYADLILAAGNSDELKPETLTNVGLKLFDIVEQLKNIDK